MAVYFSPVANDQQFDANGNPLVGGYWEVFLAGTTTPVTTYTSNTGLVAQPSSITLNSLGRPANPIWITGGVPVKFRLSNSAAVVQLTIDNVSGINDPAATVLQDQWIVYGASPTYVSATSFTVAGDQTGTFQVGRRVKTTNTGGIVYSTITASVFGASTTVTVRNDSGTLDSGLSSVSYGLLSATNPSIPLPTATGSVIQELLFTDVGTSHNGTSFINAVASAKSITPKSTSSKILVSVTFASAIAAQAAVAPIGYFQLYDSVLGLIGAISAVSAPSSSGGNGANAPAAISTIYTNTTLTTKVFSMQSRTTDAGAPVSATSMVWSLREIQN